MTCSDQHGFLYPLSKTRRLSTDSTLVLPIHHPETIKSDYTQQPTWSSAPFVEDATSIDRDYFSLSFSSSRDGKSDDTQWPTWSSAPFVKTRCLSTETTLVSPLSSRDGKSNDTRRHLMVIHTFVIQRWQVRWHTETPHGYPHLCHPETTSSMTRGDTSWLFAPLSSRDGKSNDTQRHLMVIHTFVIQRRQVQWHAGTPHGYPHLCHPETASLMRREDTSWLSAPSSTRGKRARWHAETNMVIYSLCRRLDVYQPRLL